GDLASAGFSFNNTRDVEPVKYEGRKNKDFVGLPPSALPGSLGALAASGTGSPLNTPVSLTAQELQTMKPWDDDAFHISDSDTDKLWSKVNGADFIFAIPDQQNIDKNPDLANTFVLTPASYFYNKGAWYDGHINNIIFDNICTAEMESVYSPNNGLTLAKVKAQLLAMGCQEEPKLLQ